LTLSDECDTKDWDCESFHGTDNSFFVGSTESIQVSIHPGEFHHVGWNNCSLWNPDGTVLVTALEALDLGEYGEPVGFVPEESENGIWQKETRTKEELDQELDDFRRLGEIENLIHFNQLMNYMADQNTIPFEN